MNSLRPDDMSDAEDSATRGIKPAPEMKVGDTKTRSPDDATPGPVDGLADRMAAYDEKLRCGHAPKFAETIVDSTAADPNTAPLIDCLQFLERVWPREPKTEIEVIPARIGRFRLERVLGMGGFGVVYKAFDPKLKRQVALKVPRLHSMASASLLARFEREAQAAASLDHPNIVPIYEAGQAGSVCYIAAAYCSGPNLAEWLKSQLGSVPVRLAAALVEKLAAAVHFSHLHGILHRDLKPSNVLLVSRESTSAEAMRDELPFVPRLTDFGLAKVLQVDLDLSTTKNETISLGTPAYMAPEQTGKRDSRIGPTTDIYGLGVILYELLTGRPPFQGTSAADLFDQIRNDEAVAPRRLRSEIPPDLETICLKSIEKDPARRFQTAQELAEELSRFLRGIPIFSRPLSPLGRVERWCRRKPMTAALVGVSTTAIIAIVGLLAAQNLSLVKHNAEMTKLSDRFAVAASEVRIMRHAAESNERQAKEFLYAADINRAAAAWRDEDTRVMSELLERHVPQPRQPDRRGFEWHYLRRHAIRAHRVIMDVGSAFYVLKASPDNRLMAVAGLDAKLRLFDPHTGEILKEIATGQTEVNGIAFSPDAREIATAGDDGTIRIWNLASGCERLKITAHPGKAYQLIFKPDGREIVSCGDDPVIRVFDVQSGQERRRLEGHQRDVQSLAIGINQKTFGSTSTDGTAKQWDLENGTQLTSWNRIIPLGSLVLLEDRDLIIVGSSNGELCSTTISSRKVISTVKHPDGIDSMALLPNRNLLAIGTGGGGIHLWNLGQNGELTEAPLPPWQAHRGNVYSLVWSADGSRLISAGKDGMVNSWNLSALQSVNPQKLKVSRSSRVCLIPSTDLLFHSQNLPSTTAISLYNWRQGAIVTRVDGNEFGFNEVAASRDGRFVAGVREHRKLMLLQIQTLINGSPTLQPIANWDAPGELNCIQFSPDSKTVAVSHWHRSAPNAAVEHFVLLLKLPDLKRRDPIPVPNAKAMGFSPDGKRLLLARQNGLTLWDLEKQNILWDDPKAEQTYIAFSPDGNLVATGGEDRFVVLRYSVDGTIRFRMSGHRGRIRGLAFSPDGRTLATSDTEGVVKLWSVEVGQELLELRNPDTTAEGISFSPSGREMFLYTWPNIPKSDTDELLIYNANDDQ